MIVIKVANSLLNIMNIVIIPTNAIIHYELPRNLGFLLFAN